MTTCAVGITGVQALDQMNLFFFLKKKIVSFLLFFYPTENYQIALKLQNDQYYNKESLWLKFLS